MPQATYAKCPKCGARVKKDNLRRHINAVHVEGPKAPVAASEAVPTRRPSTVRFPWILLAVLAVVAVVIVAGYWVLTQMPTTPGPSGSKTVAVIETNYGIIKIKLDFGRAPTTSAHFRELVNAGKYTPNSFHRVAANFVIQGGAVSGASNVAWERTYLTNVRYSVAMARSGSADDAASKDSATSQFFINLKDNPSLDAYTYPYVVFGHVTEGQSVVDTIGAIPTNPTGDGQPTSPVTILRVTME